MQSRGSLRKMNLFPFPPLQPCHWSAYIWKKKKHEKWQKLLAAARNTNDWGTVSSLNIWGMSKTHSFISYTHQCLKGGQGHLERLKYHQGNNGNQNKILIIRIPKQSCCSVAHIAASQIWAMCGPSVRKNSPSSLMLMLYFNIKYMIS